MDVCDLDLEIVEDRLTALNLGPIGLQATVVVWEDLRNCLTGLIHRGGMSTKHCQLIVTQVSRSNQV